MLTLYRRASGSFGFRRSAVELAAHPLPADVAEALTLSPEDNPALAAALAVSTEGYALSGGVVTLGGQPVAVNPDLSAQRAAMAAAALLQSGDPVPRAVRASDSVGYELRNNVAELLGVVIDHLEELAALPRAERSAALVAWVAADRAAWEAAGGVWALEPPAPAAVVATGADRVQADELLPLVGAAVAAGA